MTLFPASGLPARTPPEPLEGFPLEHWARVLGPRFAGRPTFMEALRAASDTVPGFSLKTQNVPALDPERDPLSRETGGHLAFCFLPGSVKGGRATVLAVIDNAFAPEHIHGEGGETIITLAGTLRDRTDEGQPVFHRAGDPPLVHAGNTRHQPSSRSCWVGIYEQPTGAVNVP